MRVKLQDSTVRLILEKLDSIEQKVDREIHGGNGKGLWEETREIKETVHQLDESVQEIAIILSTHRGQHTGQATADHDNTLIRRLNVAMWGVGVGLVSTATAVIALIIRVF